MARRRGARLRRGFDRVAGGEAESARLVAAGLAILAGGAVLLLATEVFPYRSLNHDEGVYLQQAAMLLEGQLVLEPPVPEAFRPWFFVADGAGGFYPKYAPVPAAMFAVGGLFGAYRLALAAIAAATIWLTYATVAEAIDRRVGAAAAGFVLASPLFLVQAAVFLPYVPTLCLTLLFAWAYLRADRTGSDRLALLAGGAIGLAFFARPYTAILFAAPFVALAGWRLRTRQRTVIRRQFLTAGTGLLGVAVALAYNALMTGDPLTFPYQVFAPADDLGFGHRALLGHGERYTVDLAVRAGVETVERLLTRWVPAAPLGGLVALGGVTVAAIGGRDWIDARRLALAGLFVSIPVGELYFWGTLNVLGDIDRVGDGLVWWLGPYYHIGLLVPLAAFAGLAIVRGADRITGFLAGTERDVVRGSVLAGVIVLAAVGAVLAGSAVADPLGENRDVTAVYDGAYEPIENQAFENALVYLPTTYGGWLNHPFQHLRNPPGYDGDVVYAVDNSPLPVAWAFPERQLYRYAYRGRWAPAAGSEVTPRLVPVERVRGTSVDMGVTAGVPAYAEFVSLRVDTDAGSGAATVTEPGAAVDLSVRVGPEHARVTGPGLDEAVSVPLERRDSLELRLLVAFGGVDGLPYRVDLPVAMRNGRRHAITPRLEICDRPALCGGEAAYVPGQYRDGVSLNVTLAGRPSE